MSPGKQASESEAAAAMAAGAPLETMRRRVRLSRLALFTAIAAGPVALGVAVLSDPTTIAAAPEAKPTAVRTTAAADPAGYAQLFIGAWLRSSTDDATSSQARLAHSLAPDVDLPNLAARGGGAQSPLESVTAVHSTQRDAGEWAVTVAAQYTDGQVRYLVVPVAADPAGGSFTVTGAPGVVTGAPDVLVEVGGDDGERRSSRVGVVPGLAGEFGDDGGDSVLEVHGFLLEQ
ncbi:hypothetical protein [Streptomyces sp. NPDC002078]